MASADHEAAFYFDLASPWAYLAAERVLHVLPGPAEWRPVLASGLAPRSDSAPSEEPASGAERAELERRANDLGLQQLRWPARFPFDSELAMLVATYAKSIGRVVAFAQAAFRQAFAGGRDLTNPDWVVVAAAACEMHPRAVLASAGMSSVRAQLTDTTARAAAAGVTAVPAVTVGQRVFMGDRALEDAATLARTR